ncbi:bifunctional pyr operon transcriptional regulator/uracil phosphoribosyltransferase PyrR [Inhella gelatinilytica]|uniref:Bifunctional pyr operon transcriptional regulator/uracil phosphoribosyltransferase PyrR n=1 Tax=Inhella gelatinilytica TaxID=2795030 RepID=A0A931NDL2_9BURK|nr:bifunctional pyr operon transcriptional regulator/uracil phosphoribosyltransferase PyrR [Inhella gelatinilytica]MBH9553187.1 bifunctional pyr operon transcriptional regulator/uracil phosphoribosyltransferase PyrR [Inhella gelatinilytica]
MSNLALDAETLYAELLAQVRAFLARPDWVGAHLVGIWSGGAWLAERLHQDLGRSGAAGVISSRLHRDDFGSRGLAPTTDATRLPQSIDGAPVLLVDDVLWTGRTTRAVLNELFDFGRPARVALAVLVDRNGRELPIQADIAAARISLPARQRLHLRKEGLNLTLDVEEVKL